MPSKKYSQTSDRGQNMAVMISHCVGAPGRSFTQNNEVSLHCSFGCDAAAWDSGFRLGCWADDETVGTTLKRRMQTTPFLLPADRGRCGDRSWPIISSFTSLPFQQHLTFNRPDAHPPPHPKRKRKKTAREERLRQINQQRGTEHHQSRLF